LGILPSDTRIPLGVIMTRGFSLGAVHAASLLLVGVLLLMVTSRIGFAQEGPSGPYFGLERPGMMPVVFAPGFISTEKRELNSVFSPDGTEFYFAYSFGGGNYQIMMTKQVHDRWTEPAVASFSSEYSNVDLAISQDGQHLYFGSNRPINSNGPAKDGFDLWEVHREQSAWSKPIHLGAEINSGEHQIYPTVTRDGTLYFQAKREGGYGGTDVYRSRLIDGAYTEPENLGPSINSEANEGDILISPDESFLVVSVYGRDDSLGSGDLYVSFHNDDDSWTELQNMGEPINSEAIDFCPMLSPDGSYLFFSSARGESTDIYWVDSATIHERR